MSSTITHIPLYHHQKIVQALPLQRFVHVFSLTDFSNGKIKHVGQSLQEQDVHFCFSPSTHQPNQTATKNQEAFPNPLCVDLLGGVPELHLSQILLIFLSNRGAMGTHDFIISSALQSAKFPFFSN